jgi:nucleotide-binding universal stress UspA family protein
MTTCHDGYDQDFRPRQLVVGVDDSPGSRAALGWALDQARSSNAQVVAVNVVQPVIPLDFAGAGYYPTTAIDSRALRQAAHDLLDQTLRDVTSDRTQDLRIRVIEGSNPGQVLVRAARDASMLVVGTHHRHGLGFLLGSTAASCVRHATCPVVVVPETWGAESQTIPNGTSVLAAASQ